LEHDGPLLVVSVVWFELAVQFEDLIKNHLLFSETFVKQPPIQVFTRTAFHQNRRTCLIHQKVPAVNKRTGTAHICFWVSFPVDF
jgi:hypothetical protein